MFTEKRVAVAQSVMARDRQRELFQKFPPPPQKRRGSRVKTVAKVSEVLPRGQIVLSSQSSLNEMQLTLFAPIRCKSDVVKASNTAEAFKPLTKRAPF